MASRMLTTDSFFQSVSLLIMTQSGTMAPLKGAHNLFSSTLSEFSALVIALFTVIVLHNAHWTALNCAAPLYDYLLPGR